MAQYGPVKGFILKWEGGFSNDQADRGGATNKGVSWNVWKEYCTKKGIEATVASLKSITDSQWDEIFTSRYWAPVKASKINSQPTALMIVDWAYCSGVSTVVKNVQRIVGVKADGIIGPVTLRRINSPECGAEDLFREIKTRRESFLRNIVKRNPYQNKFLKGWLNRLNSIKYE